MTPTDEQTCGTCRHWKFYRYTDALPVRKRAGDCEFQADTTLADDTCDIGKWEPKERRKDENGKRKISR